MSSFELQNLSKIVILNLSILAQGENAIAHDLSSLMTFVLFLSLIRFTRKCKKCSQLASS